MSCDASACACFYYFKGRNFDGEKLLRGKKSAKLLRKTFANDQQRSQLIFVSWRRLEDVFHVRLQKTSSRRLDQDKHIRLGHTSSRRLQDVFKMSSKRLQDVFKTPCKSIFKTSSRRLQDVFKTSPRLLQDVLLRHFPDVSKTSSRCLAQMSSWHLQDVFETSWKDVFKTFARHHQDKVLLLTRFQNFFKTNSKCLWDVLQSSRSHFWEIYGQCTKFARVTKVSQMLVSHFTTPCSGCLQTRI